MQIASVFLLALLHLVLVLGWVVLLVVPLVPGVQPGRCWHPRDIFPLFLLRPFSFSGSLLLGPTDYGCFCISMFCSPRLDWVFCFRFFSDLFCFIFLIPGCALSHARSRTLARVHTLPLARGHACSCMPVWVSSWPGTILVPTFLSPPLVFVARLPPLLVWMLAFGGGVGFPLPLGCGVLRLELLCWFVSCV